MVTRFKAAFHLKSVQNGSRDTDSPINGRDRLRTGGPPPPCLPSCSGRRRRRSPRAPTCVGTVVLGRPGAPDPRLVARGAGGGPSRGPAAFSASASQKEPRPAGRGSISPIRGSPTRAAAASSVRPVRGAARSVPRKRGRGAGGRLATLALRRSSAGAPAGPGACWPGGRPVAPRRAGQRGRRAGPALAPV